MTLLDYEDKYGAKHGVTASGSVYLDIPSKASDREREDVFRLSDYRASSYGFCVVWLVKKPE